MRCRLPSLCRPNEASTEMKSKSNDLREKDRIHQQVIEELNSLPKSINRQVRARSLAFDLLA